jgi:hypothetical protein
VLQVYTRETPTGAARKRNSIMFGRKMTMEALASLNIALTQLEEANANGHGALALVDRLIAETELRNQGR